MTSKNFLKPYSWNRPLSSYFSILTAIKRKIFWNKNANPVDLFKQILSSRENIRNKPIFNWDVLIWITWVDDGKSNSFYDQYSSFWIWPYLNLFQNNISTVAMLKGDKMMKNVYKLAYNSSKSWVAIYNWFHLNQPTLNNTELLSIIKDDPWKLKLVIIQACKWINNAHDFIWKWNNDPKLNKHPIPMIISSSYDTPSSKNIHDGWYNLPKIIQNQENHQHGMIFGTH